MSLPYVLLSCAMSIDGHIDDAGQGRLLLSDESDMDRVDEVRAGCDAVCVGAGTVRADDPRLLLRSPARRAARTARGLPADPLRVILSASGSLDPGARIFAEGPPVVVYVAATAAAAARERLAGRADVVQAGDPVDLRGVLADLWLRGVRRLMVEGGTAVSTAFLAEGLADELQLTIAPFFVGDPAAPRFVGPGSFPWNAAHRARLAGVSRTGDIALLRYALSDRFIP